MEKLISVLKDRKKSSVALNKNSKLFKTIVKAIQEKKGEYIVSLDLRKIDEAVADFFIVCQAATHVNIKAIAQNVVDQVKEATGEIPYHTEDGQYWTLLDYVNVVVHVFQQDQRKFYDIENLWADAERTEHEPEENK